MSGRIVRLTKAGGLGFAVSFFVFCVLPIGVAALGGAALTASLAKLDDPVIIAAGAAAVALPAWLLMKRRASRNRA